MRNQKYLHELLRDDQEPFRLHKYIQDRKGQLKRRPSGAGAGSSLQVTPIAAQAQASSKHHLCFLAFNASPEFPNFLSPVKPPSPPPNQNGSVFLHIPARTASLLLDAAMKIQKQSSSTTTKPAKTQMMNLFSSILKKLKDRKRRKKSDSGNSDDSSNCMLESSSSNLNQDSDEMDLVLLQQQQQQQQQYQHQHQLGGFCSTPLSPFRFSLQSTSSSAGCTPIFASPTSRKDQESRLEDINELLEKFGNKEESDKDQSSPVSVLDPPFENQEEEEDDCLDDDEDDYDAQCSFALVQRAKEKLLYKLSRFERLAELDPIELEKRMQDDDDDEYEVNGDEELLLPVHTNCSIDDSYVNQVLLNSDILQYNNRNKRVSTDFERLVSDLISEEKHTSNNKYSEDGEFLVGRVCRKLEWWKATESSTIDMMAEFDMRYELDLWKMFQQQKEETCHDFEVAILGLLVEEFTYELLQAY